MSAQSKPVTLLFNPSVYIAGLPALGLGLAAILLAGLIGSAGNAHFDGVLDTHVAGLAPLWEFLLEGFLDWLCLGLVLLVLGRIISRTSFRTVDVLGTQALARWPTLLMSVVVLPKTFQQFVKQFRLGGLPKIAPADVIVIGMVVVLLMVFLVWMVALMYQAFSVACNVKGGKAIGTFIGGLVLAEIISKICVALIWLHAGVNQAIVPEPTATPPAAASLTAPLVASAEDVSAAAAGFVDLLAKEDFSAAEARFDPAMKSAMPEARLRAVWEELLATAGPYQKQLRIQRKKQAGYDVAILTCQFEKQSVDIKVVFDSQGRVTGLWQNPGLEKH